jgi:hypothetical protein
VGQYPPPPGQRQDPVQGAPAGQRPKVTPLRPVGGSTSGGRPQVDEVRRRANAALVSAGIDVPVAIQVLVVSAVAGGIAALLDEILGLPAGALWFTFGSFIAVLSGMAYALWKNAVGLPAALVSLAAGLVAMAVWYVVAEIVGDVYIGVVKMLFTGAVVGLIGYGWFALIKSMPARMRRRMR